MSFKNFKIQFKFIFLFLCFVFYSCAPTVFIDTSNLILVNAKKIDAADDLDLKTLQQSTEASLLYLKKLSPRTFFSKFNTAN